MVKHVYIHIPFCIRKCHYCSFISGIDLEYKDIYLDALNKQINNTYRNEKIKTLYIGGGTPSLLDINDIKNITKHFKLENNSEITLEVNPETVDEIKFHKIREIGINRLSLGIQSFNDNILKSIGRNHCRKDILKSIKTIKKCGFNNINIDLIYGLPNQNITILKQDIEQSLELEIQHISTYGLKIEKNSFFGKNRPQNLPDDEQQAEMYMELCSELRKNNFEHYEISNFAKKNYESQHNCAYWKNQNYYGFGLNASGYEGKKRYRNTDIFKAYIENPNLKAEETELTESEILEEEIFLALRLRTGINIEEINKKFNIRFLDKYQNIIKKYTELNLLKKENNKLYLTEEGFLLSNEIMTEFIN